MDHPKQFHNCYKQSTFLNVGHALAQNKYFPMVVQLKIIFEDEFYNTFRLKKRSYC